MTEGISCSFYLYGSIQTGIYSVNILHMTTKKKKREREKGKNVAPAIFCFN